MKDMDKWLEQFRNIWAKRFALLDLLLQNLKANKK